MISEFDSKFLKSTTEQVLKNGRSLSKKESERVFNYFKEHKPTVMFEFGVLHGCSTRLFLDFSKWLNLNMILHSWDIFDNIKYVSKKEHNFNFHVENICGKEIKYFDKYNPNFIFLDSHDFYLTENIINICLSKKINFMLHDVAFDLLENTKNITDNFSKKDMIYKACWEAYLLGKMIDESLWKKDFYENDMLKVECVRDSCGIAIVSFKK